MKTTRLHVAVRCATFQSTRTPGSGVWGDGYHNHENSPKRAAPALCVDMYRGAAQEFSGPLHPKNQGSRAPPYPSNAMHKFKTMRKKLARTAGRRNTTQTFIIFVLAAWKRFIQNKTLYNTELFWNRVGEGNYICRQKGMISNNSRPQGILFRVPEWYCFEYSS